MNHKWENNQCVKCCIKRKYKYWKLLMAIVNHPPYDAYKTGTDWYYSKDDFKTGTFKRPNCKIIDE